MIHISLGCFQADADGGQIITVFKDDWCIEDLIIPEDRSLEAINYNFTIMNFNSTPELKKLLSSNQRYVHT